MSTVPLLTFKHIRTTNQRINIPDTPIPPVLAPDVQRLMKTLETDTDDAIQKLERWIKLYPKVGLFYNLLGACYAKTKREEDAKNTIRLSYQHTPNYMYSKISYARILMAEKKLDEVPKVFNNKFDLAELYPTRTVFHTSEALNFYAVVGEYFAQIRDMPNAWACYDYVKAMDEKDPAVVQLYRVVMMNAIPRWQVVLIIIGIVLLLIGIIALISWGIYQFF